MACQLLGAHWHELPASTTLWVQLLKSTHIGSHAIHGPLPLQNLWATPWESLVEALVGDGSGSQDAALQATQVEPRGSAVPFAHVQPCWWAWVHSVSPQQSHRQATNQRH